MKVFPLTCNFLQVEEIVEAGELDPGTWCLALSSGLGHLTGAVVQMRFICLACT